MAVGRHISLNVGREPRIYTRSVSDLIAPRDTASAVRTPGGSDPWAYTGTKYGFTAVQRSGESRTAAFDRINPLLGQPKNYRFYWSDATLSWSALNSAMGTRLNNMDFVVVSNKMTPPNINTGTYDATITAFANAVTRPTILLSPPHEPDVKNPSGGSGNATTGTAAQYQQAITRWTSLVRATGNPLIKTGIGMGFNQYPTRWAIWCPPTAVDFDFFCFDPYRWDSTAGKSGTTYADGYGSMDRALDWIQSRYGWADAKRIIVTEMAHSSGDPANPGIITDTQASNWLNGMWTAAEDHDMYAAQYFYNDNGPLISTASTNVPGDSLPPYPLARAQWFAHSGLTDPGGY